MCLHFAFRVARETFYRSHIHKFLTLWALAGIFLWFKGVSPSQFASDIVDVGMEVSYWYCNKISKPTCVFCFIMNNDMLFAVVFVEFLHFMKVSCDI